ncbi:MAG: pirin family protein [Thiovulaceae bacterium]|nr:pirin family protein [Sulfurimonadaceae bacterium]MCW9026407.1 pirin family protein [Sulfurimonadaceae bacterium]
MLKKITKESMGKSDLGWLKSRFHFSFAEYRNPANINFGVLRVLNDDIILPHSGFDMHPHENMEIVTYIIDGEISHKDSMGNEETLKRGEVQYMSAGDGIVHAEYNLSDAELRVLQVWIFPPKKGLEKLYGSHKYTENERKNKLLNIVSPQDGDSKIKLYQDVNFYVSELDDNKNIEFDIKENRQIYYVQIEGSAKINGAQLNFGDAMEITNESKLLIEAVTKNHFLFIEMKQSS